MGWLILLGVLVGIWFLIKLIGFWSLFALIFLLGGFISVLIQMNTHKKNKEKLYREYMLEKTHQRIYKIFMEKFNDEKIVQAIMAHKYWQGQTAEQLEASLGEPEDIDPEIMKEKKREIWKYDRMGKGRYALRITLENDIVVGWKGSRYLENNDEDDDEEY